MMLVVIDSSKGDTVNSGQINMTTNVVDLCNSLHTGIIITNDHPSSHKDQDNAILMKIEQCTWREVISHPRQDVTHRVAIEQVDIISPSKMRLMLEELNKFSKFDILQNKIPTDNILHGIYLSYQLLSQHQIEVGERFNEFCEIMLDIIMEE